MAQETWYVLEDGTAADPRDITRDKKNALVHKDGRAVAYSEHGPRSRSVDTDEVKASKTKVAEPKVAEKVRDMTPEAPKPAYKTRETRTKVESPQADQTERKTT